MADQVRQIRHGRRTHHFGRTYQTAGADAALGLEQRRFLPRGLGPKHRVHGGLGTRAKTTPGCRPSWYTCEQAGGDLGQSQAQLAALPAIGGRRNATGIRSLVARGARPAASLAPPETWRRRPAEFVLGPVPARSVRVRRAKQPGRPGRRDLQAAIGIEGDDPRRASGARAASATINQTARHRRSTSRSVSRQKHPTGPVAE